MKVLMKKTYAGPEGAFAEGAILDLEKAAAKAVLDSGAAEEVDDNIPVTEFVNTPTNPDPLNATTYVGPAPDLVARIPRVELPEYVAARNLAAVSDVKPLMGHATAPLSPEALRSDDEGRLKGMADQVIAGETNFPTLAQADGEAQSAVADEANKAASREVRKSVRAFRASDAKAKPDAEAK